MVRPSVPLVIGCCSTLVHICLLAFLLYGLMQVVVILIRSGGTGGGGNDEDYDTALDMISGLVIAVVAFILILEIAMLIVSIYLIIGINKERHRLLAPWVYLTGIYAILRFVDLVKWTNALDWFFAVKIIIIMFHVAVWYPVFRYWRNLQKRRNIHIPENYLVNVGFSAYGPAPTYQDTTYYGPPVQLPPPLDVYQAPHEYDPLGQPFAYPQHLGSGNCASRVTVADSYIRHPYPTLWEESLVPEKE